VKRAIVARWVKFVAMQQNSATLIYDFNTTKSIQWRVNLKLEQYLKQYSSKPEKLLGRTIKEGSCGLQSEVFALHSVDNKSRK